MAHKDGCMVFMLIQGILDKFYLYLKSIMTEKYFEKLYNFTGQTN